MYKRCYFLLFALILLHTAFSQKKTDKKYPGLLWEITGNGLKKPSYLFGTMHVSSKMAFHLSDSFYYAIKSADAVALELNPDVWQGQMVRMDQLKLSYSNYVKPLRGDYLTENSFRIKNYDDELKLALSTEPAVVNSLLYRSYKPREDFEEDTFLDLYIFQTGKKLGKRGTGVEDYYETEKIVLQAYGDMAAEKKKKTIDTDGESMRDIVEKIQDAYKRGDLDLMDSLDNKIDQSPAFREKFLYYRNEIQANSMDSIMKKSSLFVGVGAAHLPGPRGVIELLRKKGYTLRPIKMADRDATHKEAIDKLKVPVVFSTAQSEDGFYKVDVPGPLYNVNEEYNIIDRRQYADMSNGCYYQVARVKTHAAFINQSETAVRKKIDSLLYENIPGKILQKTVIQKNGYSGYDISSKTRRGDKQRYNIFITPFEVLIFKLSGKENYVDGKEAARFFSSIILKEKENNSITYTPPQGGFSVKLPHQPAVYFNSNSKDGINHWQYEATNKITGDAYLILKKTVYNVDFLDEDTFDLKLIEESFRSPDYFERQLQRKLSSFKGYPCLDVQEKMKDSSIVKVRYIIKGPHYYALAVRSNQPAAADELFSSFDFTPFKYGANQSFTDTFMHFTVNTPVAPILDTAYRAVLEKTASDQKNSYYTSNSFLPADRKAVFSNDSTGETIAVSVQKLQDYFYSKDSVKFWENQIKKLQDNNTMFLQEKRYFERPGNTQGYTLTLRDTGSSRTIHSLILLKNNYLFSIATMGDTLNHQSGFISSFFNSFAPEEKLKGRNIFTSPLDTFFVHLFSNDSATQAKAQQAISFLYYGEEGVPKIMEAIKKLSPVSKNYFDTKTKLIAELGYIQDTTKAIVVDNLKLIYTQTADTSLFQNEVMEALARHKTKAATATFKEFILQDPPVFDNSYSYTYLFNQLEDTLQLAATLFPEILQLTTLNDYKEPVMDLMIKLVDSGFVTAQQYESWFSKIFFDAKIALKKQKGNDEKKMEEENKSREDDDEDIAGTTSYSSDGQTDELEKYAILLAPFYDQNINVRKFFDKLMLSKDDAVKLNAAVVLLKNRKPVADSIFTAMAARDHLRGKLYTALEEIKQPGKFPAAFKTQTDLARSYLVQDKGYKKIDSILLVSKQPTGYNNKKGIVYFFKYRVKKDDDWKIGISGLQPENEKEVSSDDKLTRMTEKKLKDDKPEQEQFQEQLKKLLFNFHPSAKNFFDTERYNVRY
ncbi:MAG: TraB/GumN family protein [Chitinophagaceae bacterium]|nr:TraB/GumN family protein [Chitinophagaceae bacterium]